MNTFDFDNLRARWSEQGRALDERLGLDIAAVRARLDRSTASAFRRHRGWPMSEPGGRLPPGTPRGLCVGHCLR